MKKIFFLLSVALISLAFTSCTIEQDDIFDKSSAARVEEALKADYKILTSAENGWLMQYFPSRSKEFGGYNVILKFTEDGKVTVASDIASSDETATSLYKLVQSAGVTLSFDTYNDIFSLFADPSAQLAGESGEGLGGDNDFSVISACSDSVVIKGKKTGNYAKLVPMKSDWKSYIDNVNDIEAAMSFNKYEITIGENVVTVSPYYRSLEMSYVEDEQEVYSVSPYSVTENGFEFYEPVTLFGKTITGFKYAADSETFEALNDPTISLKAVIPPLSEQFATSAWYFSKANISASAWPYFNMAVQGSASEGEEIAVMFLGPASNIKMFQNRDYTNQFALTFISGVYAGALNMNVKAIDDTTVDIKMMTTSGWYQGDGSYYYNNCNYNYIRGIIEQVAGSTYKLETDDIKNPSYIKMVNVQNPDINWTLSSQYVLYPFR